jgi:hypothetical protein
VAPAPPEDCASASSATAIGNHAEKRLYVTDEPGGLDRAMRFGVAQAECDFQVDAQKLNRICELADKLRAN